MDGHAIEVWVADTPAKRQQGLQHATPEQLAPTAGGAPRGMLFVFPADIQPSFWMANTFVALDLAGVREDGTISEILALAPLDATAVPMSEPIRLALEVPAGTLDALGAEVGDLVERP